jgi:hypothetical protein
MVIVFYRTLYTPNDYWRSSEKAFLAQILTGSGFPAIAPPRLSGPGAYETSPFFTIS